MTNLKIAYIGGGSKQWARVFLNDLALTDGLCGTVALYDIDREAAERNAKIAARLSKSPLTLSKLEYTVCDSLSDALTDADFVVISILPGTFSEMHSDVHLPERFGIWQSVGDTAGPGGVLRAMRTLPTYYDFARAIKQYCPSAWVINFTNPMSACVKALYDVFPEIKAFGCCHEVFHTQKMLCKMFAEKTGVEIDRHELSTDVCGINHFVWLRGASVDGKDIMPLLPDFIEKYAETGYNENGDTEDFRTNPFKYANRVKFDLWKRLGVLPTGGDRHIVEFLNNRWYLDSPEMVEQWKFALTGVDYRIKRQEERVAESIALASEEGPLDPVRSDEEAIRLMLAIARGEKIVSNVNIPNKGQVPFLPIGAVVECNAVFSRDSVEPIMSGGFTPAVEALIQRASMNVNTLTEGILNRDIDEVFASFVEQPLCSTLTLSEARELFDEMCRATRPYLAPYFEV